MVFACAVVRSAGMIHRIHCSESRSWSVHNAPIPWQVRRCNCGERCNCSIARVPGRETWKYQRLHSSLLSVYAGLFCELVSLLYARRTYDGKDATPARCARGVQACFTIEQNLGASMIF